MSPATSILAIDKVYQVGRSFTAVSQLFVLIRDGSSRSFVELLAKGSLARLAVALAGTQDLVDPARGLGDSTSQRVFVGLGDARPLFLQRASHEPVGCVERGLGLVRLGGAGRSLGWGG